MSDKKNAINELVGDLLRDNSKVDALLSRINEIARGCNSYEYGLPMYDEGEVAILKMAVLLWVQSLGEAQP